VQRFALHDVDDAAGFVAAIVTRSGLTLSFHDREDLEQYLLVECWRLSLVYTAGGISFSTYAGNTLRHRCVDWERKRRGRTVWRFRSRVHTRSLPQLVPLDSDRDRVEQALAEGDRDREADRDADYRRLLAERDRALARDLEALGL
jgi:hypothetical protein